MEHSVARVCVQAHRGGFPVWLDPEAEVPAPRQEDALRWATVASDAWDAVHRDAMAAGCPEPQMDEGAERLVDPESDDPGQAAMVLLALRSLCPSEQRGARGPCKPDEGRSAGRSFSVAAFVVEQEPLAAVLSV